MEVLFISYKYPPSIGGMQKQSYELISGYSKIAKAHSIIYNQNKSLLLFFISLFWKVPSLLKKNPEIKVIHFNDGVCAMCCAWMKLFKRTALVVTYHGLDLVFPNLIYQKILLPIIRNFDKIITVSQHTGLECIKRGFNPSKIHVVENGVDTEQTILRNEVDYSVQEILDALTANNKKIITAIGRPVKRKGFVWFIKEVVSKLENDYVFILIGPSPNYSTTKQIILNLLPHKIYRQIVLFFGLSTEHHELNELKTNKKLKGKFIWLNQLDHNSKLYLLEKADLMVMPNIEVNGDMEGFGLVALEANVLNTPVIASGIEGITSAVKDKKNGWLIESRNSETWLKTIKQFFTNHNLNNCREFVVANYGWDKMVRGYRNVFLKFN